MTCGLVELTVDELPLITRVGPELQSGQFDHCKLQLLCLSGPERCCVFFETFEVWCHVVLASSMVFATLPAWK